MRTSLRALAFTLLPLATGCAAGGVPDREISESPIAINYLTQEEAQRRADDYEGERQPPQAAGRAEPRRTRQGRADLVASEDNISEMFSRLFGRDEPL